MDLSPYTLESNLAMGSQADVFAALDPADAPVALKVFHDDAVAALRAAEALTSVSHPNVVSVIATGHLDSGAPFVAMERLAGQTLADMLAEREALSAQKTIQLARQLIGGLAAAHDVGVIHGDLKPGNIWLTGAAEIKLLDFGAHERNANNAMDGTPEYWSPEQASGQQLDVRTDIYSLGVVLYECLTGLTPFSSHSVSDVVAQHLRRAPARMQVPARFDAVPAELEQLVIRCLAKEPLERFQTMRELSDALDAHSAAATPVSSTRRRWIAAAGTLLLIGGVLALGNGLRETKTQDATTPPDVLITLTSRPSGAVVYDARGGSPLGQTPTKTDIARSDSAVELIFRFPDGSRRSVEVVPNRPTQIHASLDGKNQ